MTDKTTRPPSPVPDEQPPIPDLLLAGVFVVVTQVEIWVYTLDADIGISTRVVASILTAVASAALAWRRTRPATAYWINAAGVIGTIAAGYPSDVYQYTNLVATFSISAYGTRGQRWTALVASIGGPIFYFIRFPFEAGPPSAIAAFVVTLWLMAWLAGRIYGARLDEIRLRDEMEVSRQLAEAREQRLVLEEERVGIARELHDIIGHTVNVMVVHAGAGRREIGRDTARVRQAFDTIETTGRAALDELDRVLAVLRGDDHDNERAPAPGLADLPTLASTVGDSGLVVDLDVAGEVASVPASVGLAGYRIVQEALTNTMRHGEARHVAVAVAVGDHHLDLSIADDGDGDPSAIVPGRGIVGIRERAAVHDGQVSIVRASAGGIEIRAALGWEDGG